MPVSLEKDPIEELLMKLLQEMQKKGMLKLDAKQMQDVVTNVAKTLKDNKDLKITPNDIVHNKELQKALVVCLANEAVVQVTGNKSLRLEPKALFKPVNEKELARELKKMLDALNTCREKNGEKPIPQKELYDQSKQLAKLLMNRMDKKKPKKDKKTLAEDDDTMDLMATLTVGALLGGIDPKNPGAIPNPVQAITGGNTMGFIIVNQGGETALSYAANVNTPIPGKPIVTESATLNRAIGLGEVLAGFNKEPKAQEAAAQSSKSLSITTPRPTPPGTTGTGTGTTK